MLHVIIECIVIDEQDNGRPKRPAYCRWCITTLPALVLREPWRWVEKVGSKGLCESADRDDGTLQG